MRKPAFCNNAKTKTQISCMVTAQQISTCFHSSTLKPGLNPTFKIRNFKPQAICGCTALVCWAWSKPLKTVFLMSWLILITSFCSKKMDMTISSLDKKYVILDSYIIWFEIIWNTLYMYIDKNISLSGSGTWYQTLCARLSSGRDTCTCIAFLGGKKKNYFLGKKCMYM